MRLHHALLLVCALLLLACADLAYHLLDSSISLDYAREEARHKDEQIAVLSRLLEKAGGPLGRDGFERLLDRDFGSEYLIKKEENEISVDQVTLRFDGNALVNVGSFK